MSSQSSDAGIPPAAVGHGALHAPDVVGEDDADRLERDVADAPPVLAPDAPNLSTDSDGRPIGSADADADAGRTGGDRDAG